MLICNTHRPSSSKRSFTSKEKIKCCEHVLRHAISAHSARPNNVGFLFGGDANCTRHPWSAARLEEPTHRLHFQEPSFIYANENIVAKPMKANNGDIGVVMGMKNLHGRQFDLRLQSREAAHDVILIGWSFTGE